MEKSKISEGIFTFPDFTNPNKVVFSSTVNEYAEICSGCKSTKVCKSFFHRLSDWPGISNIRSALILSNPALRALLNVLKQSSGLWIRPRNVNKFASKL